MKPSGFELPEVPPSEADLPAAYCDQILDLVTRTGTLPPGPLRVWREALLAAYVRRLSAAGFTREEIRSCVEGALARAGAADTAGP
jgi:hypothetical protein